MGSIQREKLKWQGILFFIWPALSLIIAIGQITSRVSLYIIVFFYGLFGITFKVYSDQIDSSRHMRQFLGIADMGLWDFLNSFLSGGVYFSTAMKPDFFLNVLNFIVSRFTNDPQYLFFLMSLLIGLMLCLLLKITIDVYAKGDRNWIGLMFIFFLLVLFLPARILSFRHYFAALFFLYFSFQYFYNGKKLKPLIIASFAVFSHFGFFIAVSLLWLYHFIGNKNTLYYIAIIASFAFQGQAIDIIRSNRAVVAPAFEVVVKGYTHNEYLDRVNENRKKGYYILGNYTTWTNNFFFIFLFIFKIRNRIKEQSQENLYSFLLLFYAFLSFTSSLASISGRFGVVFSAFCCIFFICFFSSTKKDKTYLFGAISLVFFLMHFVIQGRLTMGAANISSVLPFLPLCLFSDIEGTVWEIFGF